MWALGPSTSPTAATATTWSAGTTGTVVIVVELPSSILADLYGGADNTLGAAEHLFEPPPERPLATLPTLPRAPRQRAPRGRDPRLLRHALARMRRAA